MYSLFYSHLWEFKTLWFLTHTVYGQSTKETIQGLKVELLVLFLCQLLATIQKILVFQHTYQVIYHLKLPVFNPWIKLPKQATGLNLIIKLNVFILISCSRGYFYSKLVKLPCKGTLQLPCEFCCWFCDNLKNSFIIAIFLLIIFNYFAPEELSEFLMEISEDSVVVAKLKQKNISNIHEE